MNVEQLIRQLQSLVKDNPRAAYKSVVLAQYDSESAANDGYEPASDVHEKSLVVEIA